VPKDAYFYFISCFNLSMSVETYFLIFCSYFMEIGQFFFQGELELSTQSQRRNSKVMCNSSN
jgi:hypothetical protein